MGENTCNVEVIVNSEFNEEEKNDSQVITENYSNADVGDLEITQPVDSQEKSQEETLAETREKAKNNMETQSITYDETDNNALEENKMELQEDFFVTIDNAESKMKTTAD